MSAVSRRQLPFVVLSMFLSSFVSAQTWTPLATGIEQTQFVTNGTRVYAVRVNLCAPGIRMRATAPGEGSRTVESFGKLVNATVAINGDFSAADGEPSLPSYFPRGLSFGNGVRWLGTVDKPWYGVVGFGQNQALYSAEEEDIGPGFPWMEDVVSGQPTILWNGVVRNNPNDHCALKRARTGVGFSQNMKTLYMVVIDEMFQSVGMTCDEFGMLMLSLGAWSALNEDGGGSSVMWIKGQGVVNRIKGKARTAANHWAVMATGSGPPRSCMP